MIEHHASSNISLVRLLAFLSLALFSAGATVACSPVQSPESSGGIGSNEPKGQPLWKFETGG
jgi:hypothetical protein